MDDITAALSKHAATYPASNLTPAVIDHLGRDLADTVACAIGGSQAPGVPETRAFLARLSAPGDSRVFGAASCASALAAAQANGTAAHALDFDDTLDEGGGMHAGAAVHSAALAIADEQGGVSGLEYASAVAVGLDIAARLTLAPTQDFGWHRTSAFGVFGVTVAVGRLIGLDQAHMANAIGIAYSQASGNRQCIPDGALTKRLQSGFSARDGITAALLAQAGLTGATNAFEGRDGFIALYQRGQFDRSVVFDALGTELRSTRISLKPYPCGRNLHPIIDAVLEIRSRSGAEDIESVRVVLDETAAARANRGYPQHVVEAQFSAPFSVAVALATGAAPVQHYDQPASVQPGVRALFERVTIVAGEPAIEVTYAGGKVDREPLGIARGNPARPLSTADLEQKARDLNAFAGRPIADAALQGAVSLSLGLADLKSTREFTALLCAGPT